MIQVSKAVYDGLEAVRESARFNMFQIKEVGGWCLAHGYIETSRWITANESEYTLGIFEGFEAEPEAIDPSDEGYTEFERNARQLARLVTKYGLRNEILNVIYRCSDEQDEAESDLCALDGAVVAILNAQSINVQLVELERLKAEQPDTEP